MSAIFCRSKDDPAAANPATLLLTFALDSYSKESVCGGHGGPPLFTGDLQTWIRNEDLKPDWERVGTDVTHQGPFNASFSLTGVAIPGPIVGTGLPGLILACGALLTLVRRRRQLVA